jgi:hypothetical protein
MAKSNTQTGGNYVPLPDSKMELSENEVVVRKYHITTNKKPKARGDVVVTNKRIIYQGKGKTSVTVKELPIESVSAINTFYGNGIKWGNIILGILAIIGAIATIITVIGPIILIIVAILMFKRAYNSGYSLSIKSSAVSGTGLSVGSSDITVSNGGFFSRLFATSGQGATLSVNASPTREAIIMMNELGAIVLDLKIMGDLAIDKWKNHVAGEVDDSVLTATLTSSMPEGIRNKIPKVSITPNPAGAAPTYPQQQPYAQAPAAPAYAQQQPYAQAPNAPAYTQQSAYAQTPAQPSPAANTAYAAPPTPMGQHMAPPPPPPSFGAHPAAPQGQGNDEDFFQ